MIMTVLNRILKSFMDLFYVNFSQENLYGVILLWETQTSPSYLKATGVKITKEPRCLSAFLAASLDKSGFLTNSGTSVRGPKCGFRADFTP